MQTGSPVHLHIWYRIWSSIQKKDWYFHYIMHVCEAHASYGPYGPPPSPLLTGLHICVNYLHVEGQQKEAITPVWYCQPCVL